MSDDVPFQIPGEKRYKGYKFFRTISLESLEKIPKTDFSKDVVVACYLKTGTHWLKELAWVITHDGDTKAAQEETIRERAKILEAHYPEKSLPNLDRLELEEKHPWVIHTHLPAEFFTSNIERGAAKIIVGVRNPKDTLVSYYNFYRSTELTGLYKGTWNDFFELHRRKELPFCDYFDFYMSWLPHFSRDNVLAVHYEELSSDLRGMVRKMANFLNKPLSEEKLDEITKHGSFDSMKHNPMTNMAASPHRVDSISPFMRKGKVGNWREFFTQEQSDFVDKQYEDTLLKAGLTLNFG